MKEPTQAMVQKQAEFQAAQEALIPLEEAYHKAKRSYSQQKSTIQVLYAELTQLFLDWATSK